MKKPKRTQGSHGLTRREFIAALGGAALVQNLNVSGLGLSATGAANALQTGADSAGPSADSSSSSSNSNQPILVGVSEPLTGDKSDIGTASDQGYQVWANVVNSSGGLLGRKVKIVQYDNNSLADTATSQFPGTRCTRYGLSAGTGRRPPYALAGSAAATRIGRFTGCRRNWLVNSKPS